MGKLLPGGYYQADNGLVYGDYQSAVNAGQVGKALERAGSGILWGLTHPVELANKYEAARKSGFGFGRSASAAEPITAPNKSTKLITSGDASLGDDPGRNFPGPLGGTPTPPRPGQPTPIVQASDDTYNQLLSQYGASGIEQLAGMTSLPTSFTPTGATQTASLKDYYGAQKLQGSANLGSIISEMGYKGPMAEWAKANPMLAQREYNKRFGGATLASAVQPTGEVRGMPQAIPGLDTSKMMPTAAMQGTTFPGQGQGPVFNPAASFSGQTGFSGAANKVPAPPTEQGAAVSAPFKQAQEKAAEKTGMPNFPTTSDKVQNFLQSPLPQAIFNTLGGRLINTI